jgi:hypothetical protein
MNKKEVLEKLQTLNREQEVSWMLDLGMQLTISARGAYPVEERPGSIQHLVAFNEMQHQIYGRIRHLNRGEDWTLESFISGYLEKAAFYRVEPDFFWALNHSLRAIQQVQ